MFKIQHPLIEDQNVSYGFFTRNGGFSKQPFDTLNCSLNIDDDEINVQKNLSLVRNELDLKNIIRLHQVHSSDVIIVDKTNLHKNVYKADGLVTNVKKESVTVKVDNNTRIEFEKGSIATVIGNKNASKSQSLATPEPEETVESQPQENESNDSEEGDRDNFQRDR
mgnify:CR=1 FL=1